MSKIHTINTKKHLQKKMVTWHLLMQCTHMAEDSDMPTSKNCRSFGQMPSLMPQVTNTSFDSNKTKSSTGEIITKTTEAHVRIKYKNEVMTILHFISLKTTTNATFNYCFTGVISKLSQVSQRFTFWNCLSRTLYRRLK